MIAEATTATPTVRRAEKMDLLWLRPLFEAAFDEMPPGALPAKDDGLPFDWKRTLTHWLQHLQAGTLRLWLLEADDRVVGGLQAAITRCDFTGALVGAHEMWYVLPEWRGHGGLLWRAFVRGMREEGIRYLSAHTSVEPYSARVGALYRRAGMKRTMEFYNGRIG